MASFGMPTFNLHMLHAFSISFEGFKNSKSEAYNIRQKWKRGWFIQIFYIW